MTEITKYRFRIAVVGDSQVGKTSLMRKFTHGSYPEDYSRTIGAQFSKYEREINSDMIRLMFTDINAGIEFHFLRPNFFRYTRAAIIVFSLEDNELGKESFNHILYWHKEIVKYCGDVPIYLFANKVDVVNEDELDDTIMKKLVEENNFHAYYYTSVETEYSVIAAFNDIIMELYKRYKHFASQNHKKEEKKKKEKR